MANGCCFNQCYLFKIYLSKIFQIPLNTWIESYADDNTIKDSVKDVYELIYSLHIFFLKLFVEVFCGQTNEEQYG